MRIEILLCAAAAVPEPVVIFQVDACSIDTELRVSGPHRRACVERLEQAARLARMEMRVNEGRRK